MRHSNYKRMETEMKILVIFTGGTIGSTIEGEYISTDCNKPYVILDKYNNSYPNEIEWDTMNPYTILSENVTSKTYELLYEAVKKGIDGDYDGIIITHGSDTLQYSAAFLSLAFGSDIIPVMLVSSNYVLEDERSNGMENFRCSVDFIENKYGRGVFVPYRNTGEFCKIHYGNCLMPHAAYSDNLVGIEGDYYGIYTDRGFVRGKSKALEDCICDVPDSDKEGSGIYNVHVSPGVEYPDLKDNTKAVLLHAYHGGTICVESEDLRDFVTKVKERNIPLYLVGANPEMEYESCKEYQSNGIIVLPYVSPIYAYMRLWMNNGNWSKK